MTSNSNRTIFWHRHYFTFQTKSISPCSSSIAPSPSKNHHAGFHSFRYCSFTNGIAHTTFQWRHHSCKHPATPRASTTWEAGVIAGSRWDWRRHRSRRKSATWDACTRAPARLRVQGPAASPSRVTLCITKNTWINIFGRGRLLFWTHLRGMCNNLLSLFMILLSKQHVSHLPRFYCKTSKGKTRF